MGGLWGAILLLRAGVEDDLEGEREVWDIIVFVSGSSLDTDSEDVS